jgi:large subunit ribosomal protein L25
MTLVLQARKKVGKKARLLLNEGMIPGVVYGPKRESVNIKVDEEQFRQVFQDAGYGKVIDLEVGGEKKVKKALIREVQYDPVKENILHVSFFELDLTKPITTEVPVVTKGSSRAVEENIGFLVTPFESLEVRCLPDKLPSELTVDISGLNEIGDSISVGDLKLSEGVELASDVSKSATLAYITPPQKEIVEEEEEKKEELAEEGEEKEGEEVEEELEEEDIEGEEVKKSEETEKKPEQSE